MVLTRTCSRATLIAAAMLVMATASAAQRPYDARETRIISGTIDGPTALSRVADLTIAPNGDLYVVQPMTQSISVFDSHGAFLRTIGRRGRGPGEFMSPGVIGWHADTLWVDDPALGRISLLSTSGTSRRTIPLPLPGDARLLADGSVLLWDRITLESRGGPS